MSGQIPRILSVGAAVQDVFLSQSDELKAVCENPQECFLKLELGAKANVNKINFSTGGGATNAAVTFARQGLDAVFMGMIGHDPAGQAVLDDLDREGVDTGHVKYSKQYNTGYSVLLLAPNGERTILTYRGASTHYDKVHFGLGDITADWLYVSSLAGSMEALDHVLHQAKQKSIKVFFNPGKDELKQPTKLKGLLEDIDILSVNKEEAKQIVHGETLEELVRHLLHYVPVVIISDGPNGVMASDGTTIIRAGMYRDVRVTDRTGAGDAFGSGFLSQWAQGKSLKESIIFASANSTSVVTKIGAKAGILPRGTRLHEMPLQERKL
ncbi:PfkB family kinase, nonfunctional [Candidatus Saccharibacteria bacterium RAAC3_TM7_1]|nr:PfkB family kinase, nonfunctional [Candidatus Saccharibacteria bacterium RAAC3_TM7_1]HCZ28885.1 carbohydrate kinase family protein [Candidatus Saccharibacteria bacterium]